MSDNVCDCDYQNDGDANVRVMEIRHDVTHRLQGLVFILEDHEDAHRYTYTQLEFGGRAWGWEVEWAPGVYSIGMRPPDDLVELDEQIRLQTMVDKQFGEITQGLYGDQKMMAKVSKTLRRAELGKKL